jgi:hypothetical protein
MHDVRCLTFEDTVDFFKVGAAAQIEPGITIHQRSGILSDDITCLHELFRLEMFL